MRPPMSEKPPVRTPHLPHLGLLRRGVIGGAYACVTACAAGTQGPKPEPPVPSHTPTAAESAATGHASPAPAPRVRLGPAEEFSFQGLVARAEALAKQPYQPPPSPPADVLQRIDYDAHGKLKYKADYALFAEGPGDFPVTFFHLGRFFRVPVRIFLLDQKDGKTLGREIEYDESYFEMPADSPAHELPPGSGFAGLRFQEPRSGDQTRKPWQTNDWVAFLGATYFRAIGELYQYGISARAIAIDVAHPEKPEEFPTFTHLYVQTPADQKQAATMYALFEGPSVTGAVTFVMHRASGVVMDISQAIFLRQDVKRLGIAPLTSMYWFSEKSKGATVADWRPEVHDSDGLALRTGTGEAIWRPLNNPPRTIVSSFVDDNPKGFGLSQRDRAFDHYLDGVRYERRPTLWVEPLGPWGRGSVQLVEIPTDDEIHDNIVAMWVPESPARAGARYDLHYRLHWLADEPYPSELARVVATRVGRGGEPGKERPANVKKFVVEMSGGPLSKLPHGAIPEAVLSTTRGSYSSVFAEAVPNDVAGHWRVQFDVTAEGTEPVELRLHLRLGSETLSETWLYQWHPQQ